MATSPPNAALPPLARMYHAIMRGFVLNGRAPHYVELGRELDLRPEEARQSLHQLVGLGLPAWLHPGTDYLVAFAPFASLPTQYLITVNGQQRWYAQCGFDALAVSWLFPGKEVRLDCPCLDCGEVIALRQRDGILLSVDPPAAVGHTNLPVRRWNEDLASA